MTNWGKFENIDAKGLNEEMNGLGDGDFPEIPCGRYEVALDSMELKPTKENGYPMISTCFNILRGQYKNQKMFVNLVVLRGTVNDKYSLRDSNKFLKSLDTGINVYFESVKAYEKLVSEIAQAVKSQKLEYLIERSETTSKKGDVYQNHEIVEVYEGE